MSSPSDRTITILAISLVLCVGIICTTVAYLYPTASDRHLKEVEITQKQETERTEERSQFWQKLVPWGSDEEEESK